MAASANKRTKRDGERDETEEVASLALGAIVASAAPSSGSGSRWAQLLASGIVLREATTSTAAERRGARAGRRK